MRLKLLYLKSISKNSKSLLNRIRKFPEIISYLNNKYPQLKTLSEKVFWELYEIHDFRKCIICGKSLLNDRYDLFSGNFISEIPYCSQKCAANSILTKNSRKKTKFEKYGSETYNNINKIKKTNLKKYGCENVFSNKDIQEKIKQTNLEKYGSETYTNLAKIKQTNLKKYGCENVFQDKSIKEKIKQTNLEKYGSEKFVNPEKAKRTNLKKYGCENPMQNHDIQQKAKQKYQLTILEKWDGKHPFGHREIIEKTKKTNLEKYGCENPMQNSNIRKKQSLKYLYKTIYFDSAPEIALYIYLLDNNIDFEYQPDIKFEYLDEKNKKHYYFPDFRIEDKLYEIKGDQFFNKNGKMINPYDSSQNNIYESKQKCMLKNNIIILKSKDYQKYLDYVSSKFGKNYLRQFKN